MVPAFLFDSAVASVEDLCRAVLYSGHVRQRTEEASFRHIRIIGKRVDIRHHISNLAAEPVDRTLVVRMDAVGQNDYCHPSLGVDSHRSSRITAVAV